MATEKKTQVADHEFLDDDGNITKDVTKGVGYRYIDKATGRAMDYFLPEASAGHPLTMFGLFGAKTKAVNWSSSIRGAGDNRESTVDVDLLAAKFAQVAQDVWPSDAGGGGGFKYNLDKLTEALGMVLTAAGKPFDFDKVRKAMEDGGSIGGVALDAAQYRSKVAAIEGVRAAYDSLTGKTVSVDEAASEDDFG